MSDEIRVLFEALIAAYGPRGWWPLISKSGKDGFDADGYHPGLNCQPDTGDRFEIACGAVLTQNTAWRNAERGLRRLHELGLMRPEALANADTVTIADLIRPAGFCNQKSECLSVLARFFRGLPPGAVPDRDTLLSMKGIGPETADSILLFGFGVPVFIADAYARRTFGRIGLIAADTGYKECRTFTMDGMRVDAGTYGEFHALIVENGKRHCRSKPVCDRCPLIPFCGFSRRFRFFFANRGISSRGRR
ncbi:MAG: DNA repair protein [Spirochaetes bacterium]|nr:DNA repair protein [Spirochaetota bacterium]